MVPRAERACRVHNLTMRRSLLLAGAALLLAACPLAAPRTATAPAVAALPSPWCATGHPTPCLERLWHDGAEITSTDPAYSFLFLEDNGWDPPVGGGFTWEFLKNGGYDMGGAETGHTFRALVNTGALEPRTTFGFAERVGVNFLPDTGTGHRVDLSVKPVSMIFACRVDPTTGATTCPHTGAPGDTIQAMAYGTVDSGGWWGGPAIRDQVKGLELFTNVHVVSTPPDFSVDAAGSTAMTVQLDNSHQYSDGTLFEGFADYRVPHQMLRDVFNIPDPDTMTGSSLTTTVSGLSTPVTFAQDGDAVRVHIGPITFSERQVKVKTGTITPTRPSGVRANWLASGSARVALQASSPRGAKVRGYLAQCQRTVGGDRATRTARRSPVLVPGLDRTSAHKCRVRALSVAGPSRWSRWAAVR